MLFWLRRADEMADSARRLSLLLAIALLAEEARRWEEQFPEADHDRPPQRIEQIRLVIERHVAERVMDLGPGIEDVGHVEAKRAPAQPRMLERELGLLAKVGEQAQIECAEGREMQIIVASRPGDADFRSAPPIGADPGAE